jgi:hypothetical protein
MHLQAPFHGQQQQQLTGKWQAQKKKAKPNGCKE